MTPTLETPRLILKPLMPEHSATIQLLFPQWEIVQHLNARVPWPFPADGVETYHRENAFPAIERGEEWHWNLRLKSAPEEIIGAIGVMLGDNNRGFWLVPQHHNQGLMTEAVVAVNDYWFNTLNQPVLRAPKAVANVTSRRISEKTGMHIVATGESDYVSGRLPSETWEITREEWLTWRRQNP